MDATRPVGTDLRTNGRSWRPAAAAGPVLLFLVAYIAFDWISYVNPQPPLGITPWNPPPGLSLVLLLRAGLRCWPALFVAAVAAELLVRGVPGDLVSLVASAGVITGVYSGAAWALRHRLHLRPELDTPRDLAVFLVVTAVAALLVACAFVSIFAMRGALPGGDVAGNVVRYWIGDLNGILVFAPALLTFAGGTREPWRWPARNTVIEVGAQAATLVFSLFAVLLVASRYGFSFFSLLFLPLTWIAARWGVRGAALALVAIQVGLIAMIQTHSDLTASFVQLQSVMLVLCVTGLVLGAVVSQRRRFEAELREKQSALARALRLAAAGETTTAVAHELNQPIAALSNYLSACQLLARDPQSDPARLDEALGKAIAEVRRAGETVQRIREFFRRGLRHPQSVTPMRLVSDAVQAVQQRLAQAGIRCAIRDGAGSPEVRVDPLQVETALQNVLHNAIDALEDHDGPRTIDIGIARSATAVDIHVDDSGPGVAHDIAPHIFEPFHTSRVDGMGLGLAISRTLLRANGGEIIAETRPGGGARFTLTLPLAAAAP